MHIMFNSWGLFCFFSLFSSCLSMEIEKKNYSIFMNFQSIRELVRRHKNRDYEWCAVQSENKTQNNDKREIKYSADVNYTHQIKK